MKASLFSLLLLAPAMVLAEDDTPTVAYKGLLDSYYGYDFNEPVNHRRPGFLYNHTTTDAPAVNLALIQADLNGGWYHASLGLMAGTYSRVNLAAEPDLLQHFYDTYIGVALNRSRTLWLDVGEFASHIGFESAISADNYTLSRSLMAENSPYFLTGGRLTWRPAKEWEFAFLVVDGWQRVRPLVGNSLPGFGTKVAWTPHDRLLQRKIAHGTRNVRASPAMSTEQAHAGMRAGMEIGDKLRGRVVVRNGLKAGEKVVVAGSYALKARLLKSQIGDSH